MELITHIANHLYLMHLTLVFYLFPDYVTMNHTELG